jgi:hypothetical protein
MPFQFFIVGPDLANRFQTYGEKTTKSGIGGSRGACKHRHRQSDSVISKSQGPNKRPRHG